MTDIVDRLTDEQIAALVGRLEGEKIWITEPRPANDIEVQAANTIRALATEALESRAEIKRLRAALATAQGWFQSYADGHAAKGDTDKAKRNQDRADFCARAALGDHLAGAGKMEGA